MSDWAEPVGADGVVKWRFDGEFPCGYRWAVSPSEEGRGVQPEEQINLIPGVHVVKADWVADQAREAHDRLCACTFEDEGETWPGYEMAVSTVTLTRARYESLLQDERWRLALQDAGVDKWGGYSIAMACMRERKDDE